MRLFWICLFVLSAGYAFAALNFEPVVTDGFASLNGGLVNEEIIPGVMFNGYLYVGTSNEITYMGEIWRTADGLAWERVGVPGFGTPGTLRTVPMVVHEGMLYAGSYNPVVGGMIWRTPDGTNWSPVPGIPPGGGSTAKVALLPFLSSDGALFIGTANFSAAAQIFRWTEIGGLIPECNTQSLWPGIKVITSIVEHNGYLYAGGICADANLIPSGPAHILVQIFSGAWILDTFSATVFPPPQLLFGTMPVVCDNTLFCGSYQLGGAGLWKKTTDWTAVSLAGFGSEYGATNYGIIPHSEAYNGWMYATTENPVAGGELWRYDLIGGSTLQRWAVQGFGNPANTKLGVLGILDGYIYVGTDNEAGGQIWRARLAGEIPTEGEVTIPGVTVDIPAGSGWSGFLDLTRLYNNPAPGLPPIMFSIDAGSATEGTWPLRVRFEWDPTDPVFGGNPPSFAPTQIVYNDGLGWHYLKDDPEWTLVLATLDLDCDGTGTDHLEFDAYHFSDWGFDEDDTLPVTLSSFSAVCSQDGNVNLQWTVQSESGMLGYHVNKSSVDDIGQATRINLETIQAENLPTTHVYRYTDRNVEPDQTYYYWIEAVGLDGVVTVHGPAQVTTNPEETPDYAATMGMDPVYPNPFNPVLSIRYRVKGTTDTSVPVTLSVYNVRGQKVRSIVTGDVVPGEHVVQWDGRDESGDTVGSGLYLIRMEAPGFYHTQKAMLLK